MTSSCNPLTRDCNLYKTCIILQKMFKVSLANQMCVIYHGKIFQIRNSSLMYSKPEKKITINFRIWYYLLTTLVILTNAVI